MMVQRNCTTLRWMTNSGTCLTNSNGNLFYLTAGDSHPEESPRLPRRPKIVGQIYFTECKGEPHFTLLLLQHTSHVCTQNIMAMTITLCFAKLMISLSPHPLLKRTNNIQRTPKPCLSTPTQPIVKRFNALDVDQT